MVRDLIRSQNRLLSLLLIHAPMLRCDIAQTLGITTSALTHRTSPLMQAGLIRETGEDDGQIGPGRRSRLLGIAPDGAYAVGIHSMRNEVEVGLVDFGGRLIANEQFAVSDSTEQAMQAVGESITRLLAATGIELKKVLGAGLATIGASDTEWGVEFRYQTSGGRITTIPIATASMLSRSFPKPVDMATKARAMAVAERWFGGKHRNFLLVHAHHGVSSAVVLGGYIHQGQGHAGAMGHVQVSPDGPLCSCGKRGCLEAFVSRRTLLQRIGNGIPDLFSAAALAGEGDQFLTSVFTSAAHTVATACAPIVDVLEPEAIILVGPMFEAPGTLQIIKEYLDGNTFVGRLHGVETRLSSFGRNAGIIGAASLVFGSLVQDGQAPDWPPAKLP